MMTTIRRLAVLLCAFLACVGALTARADDAPWYQVEIILFSDVSTAGASSERWPANPGMPDLANAIELNSGNGGTSQAYKLLPSSALKLNAVQRSLQRSSSFYPIMHIGWRQPVVAQDKAVPIHIFGGKRYTAAMAAPADATQPGTADQTGPQTNTSGDNGGALAAGLSVPAPDQTNKVWEINGSLLLTRARYLHAWVDLVFTQPAGMVGGADADISDDGLLHFRMRQHRRMRSGELHYIDHPLFGMLIMVTPYTPPKSAPTASTAPNASAPADPNGATQPPVSATH